MTDPLTDHRRRAGEPPHPGVVDETEQWRARLRRLRTLLAFLLATATAVLLATALVLAVGAVHVLTPDRPARLVPVLLAAPEVRQDLAENMVSDVERDRSVPFTDGERAELVAALDDALASRELHRQLGDLRTEGGRVDGTAVVATLAAELRSQGAGRPQEVRRVLEESAGALTRMLEEEGSSANAAGVLESLTLLRRYALIGAAVLAVPGLVLGAVALAVARRRALAAVLVCSGAMLLAVLVLSPGRFVLEHLPGPVSLPGHVLAAIGQLSGPGTLWALVLATAVPPGAWWALRSLRGAGPATAAH